MPSLPQINYLGLLRTRSETAEGRYDSITRILAAAGVAGIAEGAVLAVINASTHGEKSAIRYFLMFVVVLLGFLWFKRYSLRRACALTESSICDLRTDVADKLRYCELRRFEQMSKTDILTRLSRDCTEILKSMPFIISGLASSVMLLFVAVYLTVLSRMAMAMVAIMLLLGVLVYLRRMKQVEGLLRRGVELEDRFFQVLKDMIDGFVQVKMDRGLGEDLHGNHLVPQAEETSNAKVTAQHTLNDLNLFAKTVYMCIIAAVVFLLPSLADLDEETTTKIVAAVLFLL
ncbi:MAG: ABC transporter transmembrane domain-containing protein, partial [Planctomycetota bacterium]